MITIELHVWAKAKAAVAEPQNVWAEPDFTWAETEKWAKLSQENLYSEFLSCL